MSSVSDTSRGCQPHNTSLSAGAVAGPGALALDPIQLIEPAEPFERDIPVLSFNLNGRRWRMRVLSGRLVVNGDELDTYVGTSDGTVTTTNAELEEHLREILACVSDFSRRAA